MSDDYELDISMKQLKRKNEIHHIYLNTLDEIEIRTPTGFWVIGCDEQGELIIGETKANPRLIKVVSIINHPENYGFHINLGDEVKKRMRIGEGTTHTKMKIFAMGKDLLLRPVRVPTQIDVERCAFCDILIARAPRNRRRCKLRIEQKTIHFCCKTHRKKWKKENVGKAGRNLDEPTHIKLTSQ